MYFYFFLVLCLTDPVIYIIGLLTHIKGQLVFPFFSLLLMYSILKINKWNTIMVVILSVVITLIVLNSSLVLITYLTAFLHVFILIIVFNDFSKFILEKNAISIFFLFLIAYELSNVLKTIIAYADLLDGYVLFYVTGFFQIFFGIIFSFVNVNTKVIPLSKERTAD